MCGESTYADVFDEMISFDEFVSDLKREESSTTSLIDQALAAAEEDFDLTAALSKIKTKFESMRPTSKKNLDKAVTTIVESVAEKLTKDRKFLEELARCGVGADAILAWTNQRLGMF